MMSSMFAKRVCGISTVNIRQNGHCSAEIGYFPFLYDHPLRSLLRPPSRDIRRPSSPDPDRAPSPSLLAMRTLFRIGV